MCYYDPLLLTCNFTGSHDSGIQIIIPNYDGLVLYSNNTLIETESSLPPLISVQSYRAFSYSSSTDYIIELFIEQAIVLVYEEIFCTELETYNPIEAFCQIAEGKVINSELWIEF